MQGIMKTNTIISIKETKKYANILIYKPGPINSDLKSDEVFLFNYPNNHSFNQKIVKLDPEDYVLVNHTNIQQVGSDLMNMWHLEFGSELTIFRQITFDENSKPITNVNLLRQDIYMKIQNSTRGTIQVDEKCLIKQWIMLIKSALKSEFQLNCENIRLWKHKHFPANQAIKQLEQHNGKFHGQILDENQSVGYYKADLIIIDIQLNGKWQFELLDLKTASLEEFKHVFNKAYKGCGKFYCDKNYCNSNPVFNQLQFEKASLQQFLIESFKEDSIDWSEVCWNSDYELKPIQQIEEDIIQQISKVSIYPNSFGGSFVQDFNGSYESILSHNNHPRLNTTVINEINKVIDFNVLKGWINNLYKTKESSPFKLRSIFIILHFDCFTQIIPEKSNSFLEFVFNLDIQSKNQLSQYLTHLPNQQFQNIIEALIKNLILFIKYQQQLPIQLLLKADIRYLMQQLELLQIFYKSNEKVKRIINEKFIIKEITKLYPRQAELLEFKQFACLNNKSLENYYFTFCLYPWIIPIEFKYQILTMDSNINQRNQGDFIWQQIGLAPSLKLLIDRNDIVNSALEQLSRKGINLKSKLSIVFKGEQGIDQGGLTREFFSILTQKLFDVQFTMFVTRNNNTVLWFNKHHMEMPIKYELIGMLLGLALYNQVLLDVSFPQLVFKKLMNETVQFEDLKELDLDTYKALNLLSQYEKDDIEQAFAFNFSITEYDNWGQPLQVDLIQNGSQIMVTQKNKEQYIKLCTEYYLNQSIQKEFQRFHAGFWKVVDGNGIKLLTGAELQTMILGQKDLNMYELEESTKYDGFDKNSEYIRTFWAYIHSLDEQQKKRFLFFCTGSDRVPVGGLKSLKFVIQKHGENTEQLPSAHTCFNVFLLPQYDCLNKMMEKLNIALENSEGFGLM
ncbi:unnamed protein product (macronuclear) [Paramecium tetraurelia]|uniref:HECT-type E3 ubiquitin transferase n=1 Tax=Paramecium tetraurelia TaxID=5888 RepID=A0E5N5_PARTE|nr:uncharacterized protein GSPATT00003463001 [Paramecium tetraurelia]CAK90602.1 unnamed protein product [Paramecium tetraurelia]|eukprot:XP_001457999.1 hypothetical protein (macronuclear) [Paramecium tetraurelia strain d4-2]